VFERGRPLKIAGRRRIAGLHRGKRKEVERKSRTDAAGREMRSVRTHRRRCRGCCVVRKGRSPEKTGRAPAHLE
jgi:hypothetical protein